MYKIISKIDRATLDAVAIGAAVGVALLLLLLASGRLMDVYRWDVNGLHAVVMIIRATWHGVTR